LDISKINHFATIINFLKTQGSLPYVASSSNCLIFNKIFTKPVYFNIVIYNKHLQNLLQKRKKTHNIMMNFLGTSAMIIQTILKA